MVGSGACVIKFYLLDARYSSRVVRMATGSPRKRQRADSGDVEKGIFGWGEKKVGQKFWRGEIIKEGEESRDELALIEVKRKGSGHYDAL